MPGLLALTALVYALGLGGPFLFDDYQNIVFPLEQGIGSARALWEYVAAGVAGPLGRPLALLTFAANARTAGLEPFWFKAVNLAIHLGNGVLVFSFCRRLLRMAPTSAGAFPVEALAGFAAAAWMLHPLQVSGVLYVVQRMTSLSATFCLLGLHAYLRARELQQAELPGAARAWLWLATPLCLALALLTKESGVLLVAYLGVVEFCLLRFRGRAGRADLQAFFGLFLVVPLLALAGWLALHPEWLGRGQEFRTFTLPERLLTEARALWFYVSLLLVPDPGAMSLFHDDFAISRGWLQPWTTLPAVLGLLCAVASFVALRRRLPWLAFGIGWFLAGHAMESTFVMLEPVQLHRNYLAVLGPLLASAVGLSRLPGDWQRRALLVAGLWLVCLATVTALRAHQWRDVYAVAFFEEMNHPDSARMNYEVGRLLAEAARGGKSVEARQQADRYFWRAAELNPKDILALIALVTVGEPGAADRAYTLLRERLAARPLVPTDLPSLMQLAKCNATQTCAVPAERVFGIFDAVLLREQPAAMRAEALALLSIFHANPRRDLATTIRLLQDAARLQPGNPVRHLDLATALMAVRQLDAAEAALREADAADRWRKVQLRSQRLWADLARLRAEPMVPTSP